MVADLNKGITHIDYNYLNLPERVELNTGTVIRYEYDAAGVKHSKIVDDGSPDTTQYAGPFHYSNSTLQFLQHTEGRALKSGSHWTYEYHLTDHLGNVRVTVDESGNVVQRDDYYPYGLAFNSFVQGTENLYKYNGKEEEKESQWYDYGARMYMSDIGRWGVIDPVAHEYFPISPYVYVANNPLIFIDPTGERLYFVGGANNDQDGWNYINRWGNFFNQAGVRGFTRINASTGKIGDVAFTSMFRNSTGYSSGDEFSGAENEEPTTIRNNHTSISSAVEQIESNLAENPLEEGEQFNLAGYSFGSVLQAQVALKLADKGTYIDNLILIGSPISDDSDLFKELSNNENIGNILRVDIEGDLLSNPQDILEYLGGAKQNSSDDGPHFDLARPGQEVDKNIQKVIDWLKKQGVE